MSAAKRNPSRSKRDEAMANLQKLATFFEDPSSSNVIGDSKQPTKDAQMAEVHPAALTTESMPTAMEVVKIQAIEDRKAEKKAEESQETKFQTTVDELKVDSSARALYLFGCQLGSSLALGDPTAVFRKDAFANRADELNIDLEKTWSKVVTAEYIGKLGKAMQWIVAECGPYNQAVKRRLSLANIIYSVSATNAFLGLVQALDQQTLGLVRGKWDRLRTHNKSEELLTTARAYFRNEWQ